MKKTSAEQFDLPKLVFTDIDGVWTDGGMYYTESGDEFKKFNTSDSAGVLFLKLLDIPTVIITGEQTAMVERRGRKLGVALIKTGVRNKLELAKEICQQQNVSLQECAFIGDDINDINLLHAVGISACPSNAPSYIKSDVDWVIDVQGGSGAFRAFVERLLTSGNLLKEALNRYQANLLQ